MNSQRIKEIQETTAYPESVSVKQALLQVWNECEQESNKKTTSQQQTIERLREVLEKWEAANALGDAVLLRQARIDRDIVLNTTEPIDQ